MNRRSLHPYLDHPGPIAMAHRGGAAEGAENSMAAFAQAVTAGYRYLETDVHATADDVLVAFHDETLDRVTDRTGVVAELPWSEVRHARIGGREPIPRFDEVLGAWPDVRLNVDPKSDAAVAPLLAALRASDDVDRVCVGSFSDARLRRVRAALGPAVCTSAGPSEVLRLRLRSWRVPCPAVPGPPDGPDCVQVPQRYGLIPVADRRLVAAAHALGLPVHVWTVNDPPAMRRLLDLGVDGVVTDDLGALRAVLEARGQWR